MPNGRRASQGEGPMNTLRRTISIAVLAFSTLLGSAADAVQPATQVVSSQGLWVRASWVVRTAAGPRLGYVYATRVRQPGQGGKVFLYYAIQASGAVLCSGSGLVPESALRLRRDGSVELDVSARAVSRLVTVGAADDVKVLFAPIASSPVKLQQGLAGSRFGALTEIVQGAWSGGAARASGSVAACDVTREQSAEVGSAASAKTEISIR